MERINPEGLNTEVRKWAKQSQLMMQKRVRMLTNKNKHALLKVRRIKGIRKGKSSVFKSGKLADSVKYKVNTRFGTAERIVFPFAKHGFFIAVGASRGHKYTSNPRKTIDWYNFVFDERLSKLADIVAENYADASLKVYALGKK